MNTPTSNNGPSDKMKIEGEINSILAAGGPSVAARLVGDMMHNYIEEKGELSTVLDAVMLLVNLRAQCDTVEIRTVVSRVLAVDELIEGSCLPQDTVNNALFILKNVHGEDFSEEEAMITIGRMKNWIGIIEGNLVEKYLA